MIINKTGKQIIQGTPKIEVPTRVGTCWHWGPYLKTSGSFYFN